MPALKAFRSYSDQIEILRSRGMLINDRKVAEHYLGNVNYYRLSAYWYPLRSIDKTAKQKRLDTFVPGASFDQVIELYEFDRRLRAVVLETLASIELSFRALLGYELGQIDPLIYLDITKLGIGARKNDIEESDKYRRWKESFLSKVKSSKEEFVAHHKDNYDGLLPVWVAVELLDFGALRKLYELSPGSVRVNISERVRLSDAQLNTWLYALNTLRNLAAHHARMFNRRYSKPKLPRYMQDVFAKSVGKKTDRCFAQLTLIQYLLNELEIDANNLLPELLNTYPSNVKAVPLGHIGAPANWHELQLWRS